MSVRFCNVNRVLRLIPVYPLDAPLASFVAIRLPERSAYGSAGNDFSKQMIFSSKVMLQGFTHFTAGDQLIMCN